MKKILLPILLTVLVVIAFLLIRSDKEQSEHFLDETKFIGVSEGDLDLEYPMLGESDGDFFEFERPEPIPTVISSPEETKSELESVFGPAPYDFPEFEYPVELLDTIDWKMFHDETSGLRFKYPGYIGGIDNNSYSTWNKDEKDLNISLDNGGSHTPFVKFNIKRNQGGSFAYYTGRLSSDDITFNTYMEQPVASGTEYSGWDRVEDAGEINMTLYMNGPINIHGTWRNDERRQEIYTILSTLELPTR